MLIADCGQSDKGEKVERARRAVTLARAAAGVTAGQLGPVLVHSLIAAGGADTKVTFAIWKQEVRPLLLAARLKSGTRADGAAGEAEKQLEVAALHALLRVCGLAGRADEALKVVFALRRDGIEPDRSCFRAYVNGKEIGSKRELQPSRPWNTFGVFRTGYVCVCMYTYTCMHTHTYTCIHGVLRTGYAQSTCPAAPARSSPKPASNAR